MLINSRTISNKFWQVYWELASTTKVPEMIWNMKVLTVVVLLRTRLRVSTLLASSFPAAFGSAALHPQNGSEGSLGLSPPQQQKPEPSDKSPIGFSSEVSQEEDKRKTVFLIMVVWTSRSLTYIPIIRHIELRSSAAPCTRTCAWSSTRQSTSHTQRLSV